MSNYSFLKKLEAESGMKQLVENEWVPERFKNDYNELIEYTFDSKFMKRSYDGIFKEVNDRILSMKDPIMSAMKIKSYKEFKIEAQDLIITNAVTEAWKEHRQVYIFDNDFIDYLIRTDNLRIPLQIFHSLPYKTFYIDLSKYSRFTNWLGCIVNISFDSKDHIYPNISIIRVAKLKDFEKELMFTAYFSYEEFMKSGYVEYDTKHPKESESFNENVLNNVYINFDKSTIEDEVERPVNLVEGEWGASMMEYNTQDFILFIMQSIIYLGSYKPDVVKREYTNRRSNERNADDISNKHQIDVNDVGVKYGKTFRMYNKSKTSKKSENTSVKSTSIHRSYHSRCSHIRRAHWHTYRVGPGRENTIVKWIPPVFVKGNKSANITVHKVI